MFIHGGYSHGYTNDLYKLDTSTMVWSSITTRGTTGHVSAGHSATIIGTQMFVFGGYRDPSVRRDYHSNHRDFYNHIRVFDTESDCWLSAPSAAQPHPERLGIHSAFSYNGELYIFSGHTMGTEDRYVNFFDTDINLWK